MYSEWTKRNLLRMRTTEGRSKTNRSTVIVSACAALALILFGAAPAWAVTYGTVTATATATPTCSLSAKTYTCSVAGTGTYTGSSSTPAATVYLQVEVWRCPTTTSSIVISGAVPSGCTREANVQSATVTGNCYAVCIGATKASGSATCSAPTAYNYFTRSTLWLSTGAFATGTSAVTKNVKGC